MKTAQKRELLSKSLDDSDVSKVDRAVTSFIFKKFVDNFFVGIVIPYAAELPPAGWLECNGQQVSRSVYSKLFAKIGTQFGYNDSNTFILPDLRGRFIRGWDHGKGSDPDAASRTIHGPGAFTGDRVGTLQEDSEKEHGHTGSNSGIQSFNHRHTMNVNASSNINRGGCESVTQKKPTTSNTSTESAPHQHDLIFSGDYELENAPKNINFMHIIKF